jgi:hypothetical protein
VFAKIHSPSMEFTVRETVREDGNGYQELPVTSFSLLLKQSQLNRIKRVRQTCERSGETSCTRWELLTVTINSASEHSTEQIVQLFDEASFQVGGYRIKARIEQTLAFDLLPTYASGF